MELRLIVAYSLMALLAAFATGAALWFRHNTPHRTDTRRRRRELEAYERRMTAREHDEG